MLWYFDSISKPIPIFIVIECAESVMGVSHDERITYMTLSSRETPEIFRCMKMIYESNSA